MQNSNVTHRGHVYKKKCICGNPKSDKALSCPKCNMDLIYYYALLAKLEGIDFSEWAAEAGINGANFIDTSGINLTGICESCGDNYESYGYRSNSYQGVAYSCFRCFDKYVISERNRRIQEAMPVFDLV